MKDIQNLPDFRKINIKKVGVKHIFYPITVLDKENTTQKTVATVNMYVNLPHHFKGTHMSRFVEILNQVHGAINLKNFHTILSGMKDKLQAQAAHIEIEFPYFLKKNQGGQAATVEYICRMHGSLHDTDDLIMELRVPIAAPSPAPAVAGLPKSLGNWGVAAVQFRFRRFVWIEDLIRLIESVTCHNLTWPEQAGGQEELSVEGLTRNLGRKLRDHPDIRGFKVNIKNYAPGGNTFAELEAGFARPVLQAGP